jgi:hypothetical protein
MTGDGVSQVQLQQAVDELEGRLRPLLGQLQGVLTSRVMPAPSTVGQGPSAIGTDLVYTQINLALDKGTWLVYAQATLSSQANADSKQIGLWNATDNVDVPSSKGPALDTPAINVNTGHSTWALVTLTKDSTLRIKAFRNGASQVTIGYPGALVDEQRMMAFRLG